MADLNALLVFAGVADAGSFSSASRRLGIPVSTVSRQVAGLEDQLGLRLIERSTRRFRVTEAGGRLLEQARRGLEVSEAVDRLVAEQTATVTGLLRLSAPPGIAAALLAPVIAAFATAYPDVRLQVSTNGRSEEDGADQADLILRLGTLEDSSLIALRLLRLHDLLVASPSYLAEVEAPVRPGDLAQQRLLTLPHRSPNRRWTFVQAEGPRRESLHVRPHLVTDDASSLVAVALAGGGIGVLPAVVRPDLVRDGRLVEVMPAWKLDGLDLVLLHLGRRHVPRTVQLFKDMAARIIPGLFAGLTD